MLRRIGVLASLAVTAAMFAGVSSAQADVGVCVFQGLAGTLDPDIPNIVADASNGDLLDIEQGAYVYTGSGATCAGSFTTPTGTVNDVDSTTSINSSGFYDNIVCGTGFAHDLDGLQTNVNGVGDTTGRSFSVTGAGYQIPFVGGVGPLLIGPNGAPSLAGLAGARPHAGVTGADGSHGNVSSAWTGAGLVSITPGTGTVPPTENCINSGTSAFQVKGFFVAVK